MKNGIVIQNGVVLRSVYGAELVELGDGESFIECDPALHRNGTAYTQQPIIVSPRQIRQALTASGLRAQVEAAVAAGDQDLKDWWEFATAFESNHPMVVAMAQGLGVTEQQLTDLFTLASTL